MSKKILSGILLASLVIVCSCKQKSKNAFSVSVVYSNADKLLAQLADPKLAELKIYLEEVPYGKDMAPVVLDSAKLPGSSGTVVLNGAGKAQSIYELVVGQNILEVPLINDEQQVKVTIDLSKRDDYYQVEGSNASKQLKDLIGNVGQKNFAIEKSFAELDSLKRINAPDSITISATQKKNAAIADFNNYLKNFIRNTNDPTLGILALSWGRSLSKEEFGTALDGLIKKYPDNVILQNMKRSFARQGEAEQQQHDNSWVGKQAPELSLPDMNGKNITLSSFKGKFVLVDFWASWCEPCRMENPNVVKAYKEFKNKNFTILGVSLDSKKDAWQQAVQQDNLNWTQISDLKYWGSEAVNIFKFEGIPFNVLVDPQGKVVAQELRGENLETTLKEVLK